MAHAEKDAPRQALIDEDRYRIGGAGRPPASTGPLARARGGPAARDGAAGANAAAVRGPAQNGIAARTCSDPEV